MQEVQRFNKVLKSLVLFGDLILLNLLLWGFNLFLGTRFLVYPLRFYLSRDDSYHSVLFTLQCAFRCYSSSSSGTS